MSTLKLSLNKAHLGSEITNGVVARVQHFTPSDDSESPPPSVFHDVVIPAGREASASLEVAPGRYRIQAFLPSGHVLQEDREVRANQEVTVRFEPGPAGRAWLSWQRFEGNEPDADALTQAAPIGGGAWPRLKRRVRSALLRRAGDWAELSATASADAAPLPMQTSLTPAFGGALMRLARWIPEGAGGRESGPGLSALGELEDLGSCGLWAGLADVDEPRPYFRSPPQESPPQITRREHEGSVTLWKVTREGYGVLPPAWLLLETADDIEIARLPLPWFDVGAEQFTDAEAVVDESLSRPGARLSLTVRDRTLGGLLAYLGRGAVPAARVLLDALDQEGLIDRTIAAKQENPLAACAAAYAGLALFEPGERERWDSWLPNIMNWFNWLPDGAIVHARRMILRPYQSSDREEALTALKTAYRAGVPYFSAGVQHLRDGLLLYAPRDEEAKAMLNTVSRLARRIDNGQIFTVIRYPKA